MSETYECSLSEKSLKKAKKELGEDPKQRMGAVETFREWILQQKHIKCETDTLFLLRFLRSAKFSQLRARELLENYLKAFVSNRDWTHDIDMQDPEIQAFLKDGYFSFGGVDSDGRTVCVLSMERLDISNKKYSKSKLMKAMVGMYYAGFFDEENQVNGNIYLCNATGYSMKHQTYFSMDDMKRNTKMWQNAFPARYKGFHYFNVGPVFESIMSLMKPIMSKKWAERIKIHSNLESAYKYFDKKCLPVEFLPDEHKGENAGTLDTLIEKVVKDMSTPEVREHVLRMSDPKRFHIDLKEKDTSEPQASFRKLNID